MRSKERCSSCSRTRVHYFSTNGPPTCWNTTIKLFISKLPASVHKSSKVQKFLPSVSRRKLLNPCYYQFMCKVNNQQLLSICVRTSHDIYVFKSNEYFVGFNPANFKVNTFLLELDNYLNWIFVNQYLIKYGIESIFRDGICHSRHSRRECKIFASGVNFSRNNAVCYHCC